MVRASEKLGEKLVQTACPLMCSWICGIMAHVKDGVLVKVEPAELPGRRKHGICALGLSMPKIVYHPERLKYPLKRIGKRGEGKWQRISWEEALDTIAIRLKEVADKYGPDSVAWTVIPMASLLTSYWRLADVWGGIPISMIGYGDGGGPCGDTTTYGTKGLPGGTTFTTSFESPGLCVVWGENSAETTPADYDAVIDAKEKGARLVVIDPRFTPTAAKAHQWIAIRPGTDAALALGMMDIIISRGLEDKEFVLNQTVGPFLVRLDNGLFLRGKDISSMEPSNKYVVWDTKAQKAETPDSTGVEPALRGSYIVEGVECKPAFQLLAELTAQYPVEKTAGITDIDPEAILRLAEDYVRLKPVNSYRGMGAQRAFHGDLTWRAISALAAVTGNISLTPYQGFNTNLAAFAFPLNRAPSKMLPLMTMLDAILTEQPHPVKAIWLARHNMLNQLPNLNKMIKERLPGLDLIVVADIFMNTTAEQADFVLPVCTYFECTDLPSIQGMLERHLQLQQKAIEPLYECKSDFQMAKELAPRLGVGQYFDKSVEEYLEMILTSNHPSMEGVSLENLRRGPALFRPYKTNRPPFRTQSSRIEFYSEDRKLKELGESLPVFKEPPEGVRRPLGKKYPLSLMTPHSKFGIHSAFANVDWQREIEPEPVLEMNPVDAKKRGIYDGDVVVAFNDRGKLKIKAMIHQGIKPGAVSVHTGWWRSQYAEGSHNTLTHDTINPAMEAVYEPNEPHLDVLVEVKKAVEE